MKNVYLIFQLGFIVFSVLETQTIILILQYKNPTITPYKILMMKKQFDMQMFMAEWNKELESYFA